MIPPDAGVLVGLVHRVLASNRFVWRVVWLPWRVASDTLHILERQRLVRLLIKEVLVGHRHRWTAAILGRRSAPINPESTNL